jgi:hypothetical protein
MQLRPYRAVEGRGLMSVAANGATRGSRDGERIDLDDAQDVSFWTSELEISKEELYAAVQAVGPGARNVREHLVGRFTRF